MSTDASLPQDQMMGMIQGFQMSQAVYVVTKLGVPDILTEGPQPIKEIAATTGAHENSLRRILRTLSSAGVFQEVEPDSFALTPLGTTLTKTSPFSLRDMNLMAMETLYAPFGDLLHTAKTGEPAAKHYYGESFWEWLAARPEQVAQFSAAMASSSSFKQEAINSIDWSSTHTLVDIGGADGTNLASILQREPSMQGIVFDLPHVVQSASNVLTAHGVNTRAEIHEGSFFESVPPGVDAYFLSSILHDWNDEECLTILRHIKAAATPGAQVKILEFVMPPDNAPLMTAMLDLTMLGLITGRERSTTEWETVITQAGLSNFKITPTPTPLFLIEATVPN